MLETREFHPADLTFPAVADELCQLFTKANKLPGYPFLSNSHAYLQIDEAVVQVGRIENKIINVTDDVSDCPIEVQSLYFSSHWKSHIIWS